ncbi:hypothetical protein ACFL2O_09075 [Thermodesulfobacteriota bacterium]
MTNIRLAIGISLSLVILWGGGCGAKYHKIPVLKVKDVKGENEMVEYDNGWKARKVYDKVYERLVWEIYDPETERWYRANVQKRDNTFNLTAHSELKRQHDYSFDDLREPGSHTR